MIVEKRYALALSKFDHEKWRGTRETDVMPNTAGALVDRGLLELNWPADNRRRLTWRLTTRGYDALVERFLVKADPKVRAVLTNRDALVRISAERIAAGVCRHCGGPVPCWSPYGDVAVGVRRD